jgi:hypothetical protein
VLDYFLDATATIEYGPGPFRREEAIAPWNVGPVMPSTQHSVWSSVDVLGTVQNSRSFCRFLLDAIYVLLVLQPSDRIWWRPKYSCLL